MQSRNVINAPVVIFVLLLAICQSMLYPSPSLAQGDIGNDVASLCAPSVYNFDDHQLQLLLKPFMEKQLDIKALKVFENVNNALFLIAYREDREIVFGEPIPDELFTLDKLEAPILYEGEEIGHVVVYYEPTLSMVALTAEEAAWVASNEVSLGMFDWPPFILAGEKTKIDGIIGEYLRLAQKYTGLRLKVSTGSWDTLLQGIKNGTLDLLPAVYFTKERASYGLFSKPFFRTPNYLYARAADDTIHRMSDLNGKKLAIVKGYATIGMVRDKFPEIEIVETDSLQDSIIRVLNGDADALYESQINVEYRMKEELIVGLRGIAEVSFKAPSLHFFMRKDLNILHSVLQKGLDAIPQAEKSKIVDKWIPDSSLLNLSDNERAWLNEHQPIRYSYDPDWRPLEWSNELDEHAGIIADLLKLIQEKSGIEFQTVPSKTWSQALEQCKAGDIDMLSGLGETTERKQFLNFTNNTLYSTPFVFVSRDGEDYPTGFADAKGKKIGVLVDSTIHGIMDERMPDINLINVANPEEGFERLSKGKLDILLINADTANYYKNYMGYDDTQISYRTDFSLELKVAFNKHAPPEPLSIIAKSIDVISEKELSDVVHKWTSAAQVKTDWAMIGKIAGGLVLVILFFVWSNRKLKTMVEAKTQELQRLLHSFDQNVLASATDPQGVITYVSTAFCRVCGYSVEELVGNTHKMLRHPDTPQELYEDMWGTILQKKSWRGEFQSLKKNGESLWVDAMITPELDEKGNITGFTALRQDITAKKEVENLSQNLERMVEERTVDLEKAKAEIEEMHKHTAASIQYAALLQSSLTPDNELFRKYFQEYFAIWHPRDVVGGDIYFFNELRHDDECLLLVIDCVGHGVPGAFVTMLVKAVEQQVMAEIFNNPGREINPSWVLQYFNQSLKKLLRQEDSTSVSDAGFDGAVLYYNKQDKFLTFAGAAMPLFYKYPEDEKLSIIKGDKHSIGYRDSDPDYKFKDHRLEAPPGMVLYLTTDGYLDQNGGPKGFGFGKKRFKAMIHEYVNESMADQQEMFLYEMAEYQGDKEQRDDITVVGLRI